MYELTAENVKQAFGASMFQEQDPRMEELRRIQAADAPLPDYVVLAAGVITNVGFCREQLETQRQNVRDMLSQLPEQFHQGTGDGWSFLQACLRRDGYHWGEHRHIEQLLLLGIALGYCRFLLPRDMWKVMPGGMPYFGIALNGFPAPKPMTDNQIGERLQRAAR